MPELPEVETIARGLARRVVGKRIAAVAVSQPKVTVPPAADFSSALAGERIAAVGRRGKFVVIGLGSGRSLAVHLRMTGRLVVAQRDAPAYPYTNVCLLFSDATSLRFSDARRFGRMWLLEPNEPWDRDLGVEPLSEAFTAERFSALLGRRTTPIKAFLLDQRRIAGIGNIYACEALWEARIRPSRAAGALSRARRERLHCSLRAVLRRAIAMGGSSVDDYVDADGLRGGFQNELSIYGRAGQGCRRCGSTVVRTVLAQRGTWWCRSCQR